MSFQILQRAYAPYGTAAQFPASGDSRLIYRATDTGYLYTWDASESAYKLAGIDPATVQSDISTLQTDVSAAEGNISTLQGDVATLTQGIASAVSTHNTAGDSHADIRTALAGKQNAGIFAGSSTPGGAATTALACTGNAATATKAASCTGNSATATTASSCSGNAATATTLATARTLTMGSTGKTFNGAASVSWTLAEMGAVPLGTTGTFTPAFTAETTAPTGFTYYEQSGSYYKIGNMYICDVRCRLSSKGTGGVGLVRLTGFPAAFRATGYGTTWTGSMGLAREFTTLADSYMHAFGRVDGATYGYIARNAGGGGNTRLLWSDLTNTSSVLWTIIFSV